MKLLKRLSLAGLAAGAFLFAPVAASPSNQPDLEAKYQEKLSKRFIKFGGWVTDFDEARARAKAEDKVLFVYFSRSYAP